jgi:hypothetical protein
VKSAVPIADFWFNAIAQKHDGEFGPFVKKTRLGYRRIVAEFLEGLIDVREPPGLVAPSTLSGSIFFSITPPAALTSSKVKRRTSRSEVPEMATVPLSE